MKDFRLCYVDEPWAWFTTAALKDQWGDDWNDAPYEHNAERPYGWHEGCGVPPYELLCIAWEGPFETPSSWAANSPYSVQDINSGAIPWLKTDRYDSSSPQVVMPAGTILAEFVRLVELGGGTIYLPRGLVVP